MRRHSKCNICFASKQQNFEKKRNKSNRIKGCDVTVTLVVMVNLACDSTEIFDEKTNTSMTKEFSLLTVRQPFCLNKLEKKLCTQLL